MVFIMSLYSKAIDVCLFIVFHLFKRWEDEAVGDDAGPWFTSCLNIVFKRLHPPWQKVDEDDVGIVKVCNPKVLPTDYYCFSVLGKKYFNVGPEDQERIYF